MLDFSAISPMPDFRRIGNKLPRQRGQHGELKRLGKKKWWARWYVRDENDRRKPITKTFEGHTSKFEAQEHLDGLIAESLKQPGVLPAAPTFAQVWDNYVRLNTAQWTRHYRVTIDGIIKGSAIPLIGDTPIKNLKNDAFQNVLNRMAESGLSVSSLRKCRIYMRALTEHAMDLDLISKDPIAGKKKLKVPSQNVKAECERFLEIEEVKALLGAAPAREHLILRLFIVGGLRSCELFALRPSDVQTGRVLIDEGIKRHEQNRVSSTLKTNDSKGFIAISGGLQAELLQWAEHCGGEFLFPASRGDKPFHPANYLKRILQPLAESVKISGLTYQALRRTCATWFKADVKSAQAQLRHSQPQMTAGKYMKTIDSEHRAAVEELDTLFMERKTDGLVS